MRWILVKGAIAALAMAASLYWSAAEAADKVKLTLNGAIGVGHVQFVYAEKLGYYKNAGIELELEQGRGSVPTTQVVALGRADAGYVDAATAINLASQGAPVKIIAVIRQVNSFGLVVLADSKIKTPKDLEGKKVAICPGCAERPLFDAMLSAQNVDKSKIEIVNAENSAFIGLLAERKVDAFADVPEIYIYRLRERGIATEGLYFRDYGVPLFSLSLIANENKLKERPDVYRRFIDASLQGLAATIKNPDDAIDTLRERHPDVGAKDFLLHVVKSFSKAGYCARNASVLGNPPQYVLDKSYEIMTTYLNVPAEKPMSHYLAMDFIPKNAPPC